MEMGTWDRKRRRAGRQNMHLIDMEKAEYIANGAGALRQNRGPLRRTFFFRIFCEMYLVSRKQRIFSTKHHLQGRAPRRAPLVALSGFAVPLLTTVGGALFVGPDALLPKPNHGAAEKRG